MSMPESFEALRRANPRAREGFAESVEAAAGAVHDAIAGADDSAPRRVRPRRRVVGLSAAGAALAVAVAVVAFGTLGSSGVQRAHPPRSRRPRLSPPPPPSALAPPRFA
jgi:ferric-dicitrate binding protein FerR (iron transport regulator)